MSFGSTADGDRNIAVCGFGEKCIFYVLLKSLSHEWYNLCCRLMLGHFLFFLVKALHRINLNVHKGLGNFIASFEFSNFIAYLSYEQKVYALFALII